MSDPSEQGAPPIAWIRGSRDYAAALGISQPELLRLVHRGEVPFVILGGTICVPRELLVEWAWQSARAQQRYNFETTERQRAAAAKDAAA